MNQMPMADDFTTGRQFMRFLMHLFRQRGGPVTAAAFREFLNSPDVMDATGDGTATPSEVLDDADVEGLEMSDDDDEDEEEEEEEDDDDEDDDEDDNDDEDDDDDDGSASDWTRS